MTTEVVKKVPTSPSSGSEALGSVIQAVLLEGSIFVEDLLHGNYLIETSDKEHLDNLRSLLAGLNGENFLDLIAREDDGIFIVDDTGGIRVDNLRLIPDATTLNFIVTCNMLAE